MKIISLSVVFGIMISLALFWLMQMMISNNQQGFKKTENIQMTEFVRLKRETKLQTKDRKIPDEPPEQEKRPPPPTMQIQQVHVTQNNVPQMDMPNLDIPVQTNSFSGSLIDGVQMGRGGISTSLIPLVRIQPNYPRRAQNRGIKGWVKIRFTITKEGTVKGPVVIDAQPANIFNRASLKAIRRWKFKPKVMAGVAVEQIAEQRIDFGLSK